MDFILRIVVLVFLVGLVNAANETKAANNSEQISKILQDADLTSFSDMDRLFELSAKLPPIDQLNLIRQVLSNMRSKAQYQHLYHVILQLKFLKESMTESAEKDLLSTVEGEIPSAFKPLLSDKTQWKIKRFDSDEYIFSSFSPKYERYILLLDPSPYYLGWLFRGESSNSSSVFQQIYKTFAYIPFYLSIEYIFHNDSSPVIRSLYEKSDVTQNSWYPLMSNDLAYVQIKNVHTNELLVADNVTDTAADNENHTRVTLSRDCTDCDASKWSLKLQYIDKWYNEWE